VTEDTALKTKLAFLGTSQKQVKSKLCHLLIGAAFNSFYNKPRKEKIFKNKLGYQSFV
jgi:hypothetical protein